jgi:hypothetical protein
MDGISIRRHVRGMRSDIAACTAHDRRHSTNARLVNDTPSACGIVVCNDVCRGHCQHSYFLAKSSCLLLVDPRDELFRLWSHTDHAPAQPGLSCPFLELRKDRHCNRRACATSSVRRVISKCCKPRSYHIPSLLL